MAGALLAFALSFDEIIVTTFTAGSEQTLPIWIFSNYSRPNQLPIVNVVGLLVIVISIIPVYFANRLTQDPSAARARRGGGGHSGRALGSARTANGCNEGGTEGARCSRHADPWEPSWLMVALQPQGRTASEFRAKQDTHGPARRIGLRSP